MPKPKASYCLPGPVPSKKNSRVTTKSGRSFPSARYQKWHAIHMRDLKDLPMVTEVKKMLVEFILPDNRRRDLSNMFESVADLLVDAGIIEDDCWQKIPHIEILAKGVSKSQAMALVTLY